MWDMSEGKVKGLLGKTLTTRGTFSANPSSMDQFHAKLVAAAAGSTLTALTSKYPVSFTSLLSLTVYEQ